MSAKRSERILGPWEQRGGWHVMIAVKALLTQALDAVEATPKHRGK